MTERQSARMSKIKNGGLDQYGARPFEQQQFGTASGEGVKSVLTFTTKYVFLQSVLLDEVCKNMMWWLMVWYTRQIASCHLVVFGDWSGKHTMHTLDLVQILRMRHVSRDYSTSFIVITADDKSIIIIIIEIVHKVQI